jgi:chromosome segregation ATPase
MYLSYILAVIAPIVTAGVLFAALGNLTRKFKKGEGDAPRNILELQEEIQCLDDALSATIIKPADYVSRAQFEYASESLAKLESAVEASRSELKAIEADLEVLQSEVEGREIKIQSLKGSKEEEAKLLQQIGQEFQLLNSEAEDLRSNLTNSLEDIKKLESELTLTQAQIEQLVEFQNIVTNTVSRLKELSVEGQEVERRLKVLSQQYRSLEEEYTKLVEQQFA